MKCTVAFRSLAIWTGFLLLLNPVARGAGDLSPRAAKVHQNAIVVDLQIDTPQRMLDEGFDLEPQDTKGHIDLPRMRAGGLDAGFMSIWVDMRRYPGEAATKRALQLIDVVYRQVQLHPGQLALATTAGDIRRAHKQGKIALLMGMEGGTPIADDLGLLRVFYRLGIRYMTLTHSLNNNWADSSTDEPRHNGLTDFGKEVVREMNRLGMLVDISHVSDKAFYDALAVTQAPVIASHSSARALCNVPRNMDDEMIRAVAKNGGVIHVNYHIGFLDQTYVDAFDKVRDEFRARMQALSEQYKEDSKARQEAVDSLYKEYNARMPRVSWERILDHIDHMVRIAGVDHVGLGSDFDGAFMPEGMDDASFLPRLTEGLLRRGYKEADVKKILGGNTLRVLEEAERVAARLSRR